MNKKELFILLITFIFIVIIGTAYSIYNQQNDKIPPPNIKRLARGDNQFGIALQADKEDINLPSSLTIYRVVNEEMSPEKIEEIANHLGFNNEPNITTGAFYGTTYTYSDELRNMRVVPSKGIIDYKLPNNWPNNLINQLNTERVRNEVVPDVQNYLKESGFIDENIDLQVKDIKGVYIGEEGVQEGTSNTIIISFVKTLDNYPVMSSAFEMGTIGVSLNSELEIFRIYLDDVPEIIEFENIEIKNIEEIESTLNEAIIQSLNKGKIDVSKASSNIIRTAIIKDIQIVYLQEAEGRQNFLQPVFLLIGEATLDTGETVSAEFYLQAIK